MSLKKLRIVFYVFFNLLNPKKLIFNSQQLTLSARTPNEKVKFIIAVDL